MQDKIVNPSNCITSFNNNRELNKLAIATNNSLNKIELRRFKSNEAYFSPKAKTHRKNKLFLNVQKSNKKIEINLNDQNNNKKDLKNKNISIEKMNKNNKKNLIKFSPPSKKSEINKNTKAKPNFWFKSKNINQMKPTNKTKYMINNINSSKPQNKYDILLKEESIKELEAEELDDNNNNSINNTNNNTSINKNNRNNVTNFNINTVDNNTYENKNVDINNNGNKKTINVSIILTNEDNPNNNTNNYDNNKINIDSNKNISISDNNIKLEEIESNIELLKFSKKGDKEKVLEILNNPKVNINYKNENGWTALHYACDEGNLKIVEILIKAHIDINIKNNDKKTALHLSAFRGYFDITKILIDNGADLNALDNEKNLAIHLCALNGHNELLSYLLEKKYSYILNKNLYGSTILDLAKNKETKAIIEKYIKYLLNTPQKRKNSNAYNSNKKNLVKKNFNINNYKNINSTYSNNKSQYQYKCSRIIIQKANQNQIKSLITPIHNYYVKSKNKNKGTNFYNVINKDIQNIEINKSNNLYINSNKNLARHKKIFSNDDLDKSSNQKNIFNDNNKPSHNNVNKSTMLNKNKKSSSCFNISTNTNKNEDNNTSVKSKDQIITSSQNKNESSNLNIYYNTSSHIKSKTNIFGILDSNKNFNLNTPGNFRKLTEFFTNKTTINDKNYSGLKKTPNLKEQSIKSKKNPNINNYLCKSINKIICKSRSKVITKSNKILNKKIVINNKAKSPNKIFFSNTNTNKKLREKDKKINNYLEKKKSQMRFSKRTVSLPGFLSVNNSKLKEKNKTKSTLKQISKINIKGFNNNNFGRNSKSKKSINKSHAKNKNNNKRSSNNIANDNKYINNFPKTYSNIQDNLNSRINISNSINKSSLKVDKICTDEEDNLIEDLEEEEIIVNLKEKKRPTLSSNSNLNINETSKCNESNNKSNIIEKEIKSINKKKINNEISNNISIIHRKSENSSNITNNINNNSNFTNSINNAVFNNSNNNNNRSSTNTNTNLNESNNNENYKENENNINNSINNSNNNGKNLSKNEKNENSDIKENKEKIGPSNFICLALLGQGSFGEVYLVNKKYTNEYYAMKVLDKKKIEQQNIFKYAMTERNVLSIINFPFIVKLNYAFQTKEKLFLLLDYCPGGDLSKQLLIQTRFSEPKAKFYICEITLAIGELHKHDIIFRDLKPDNIVIDQEGHAMLTDFGLSKEGVDDKRIAKSFCGSVAYLAPEMLNRTGHGKAVDWYLLGVVFFEMLVGLPPYFSNNQEQIFKNIDNAELIIPNFISKKGQNLIRSLLIKNPLERLGSKNDVEDIKNHPYFDDIDWNKIYNREYMPPPIIRDNNKIKFFGYPQYFSDDNNINKDESLNSHADKNNNYEGWSFVQNSNYN